MRQLSTANGGAPFEAAASIGGGGDGVCSTLDAMPALPRFPAPGSSLSSLRIQLTSRQDVLCSSKDCPIFYMRKKAQKDVADATLVLERCTSRSSRGDNG